MRIPAITGLMARRLLINWRIDPDVAGRLMPEGVRPKLVGGQAIAGLCIVCLKHVRPVGLPAWFGVASENVATRMAVEWDAGRRESVLIFRRDTGSRLNHFLGSRLFPGVHHRAAFAIAEQAARIHARMASCDGTQSFDIAARDAGRTMAGSVFEDLAQAERFFRGGECGYSPTRDPAVWDGVALRLEHWNLMPMQVDFARSSFFDDVHRFPPGSATLDSAYILRDIPHAWRSIPQERWGALPAAAQARTRSRVHQAA